MSHKETRRFKILPFGQVMNVAEAIIKTSRGSFVTVTFNVCWKKLHVRASLRRIDVLPRF